MSTRNHLLVNLRLIAPSWVFFFGAAVVSLPSGAALLHISPVFSLPMTMLSFWAGAFITTTQPWSAETRFGTLPSLLVQPVTRYQLWKEKALASAVAVVPLLVLHAAACARLTSLPSIYVPFALVWTATVVLSAMPLGFLIKSQLGLVLHLAVIIGVPCAVLAQWGRFTAFPSEIPAGEFVLVAGLSFVVLAAYALSAVIYSGQAMSSAELPMLPQLNGSLGPSLEKLEQSVALLRPSRTSPILNFILKELRLLWALWLFVLIGSAVLIGGIPFKLMAWSRHAAWLGAFMIPIFILAFMAILLPGFAYAEERLAGLHTLHMMLPLSARKVWLLRAATLVVSVAIAMTWIFALSGVFFGVPLDRGLENAVGPRMIVFPILIALASLTSLCWSTVGGGREVAIGAVVGVPTAMFVSGLAGRVAVLDLSPRWLGGILGVLHPYPISNTTRNLLSYSGTGRLISGIVLLSFLMWALARSYRTFSLEPLPGLKPVFRYIVVAGIFSFLSGFSLNAPAEILTTSKLNVDSVFDETALHIFKLPIDHGRVRAGQPLAFSAADLERNTPLSSRTRRWLGRSTVVLMAPKRERVDGFRIDYDLHLNLNGGWTCTAAVSHTLLFDKTCEAAARLSP